MTAIPTLIRGTTRYVKDLLDDILGDLNADLAASVVSTGPKPVFLTQIGEIPNTSQRVLAVKCPGDMPAWDSTDSKVISIQMRIKCMIPTAGDNTPMNIEMARQVSMEHVLSVFEFPGTNLRPIVNGGGLGNVEAVIGDRGPIVDLFPMLLADRKTVIHGWSMMFNVQFSRLLTF